MNIQEFLMLPFWQNEYFGNNLEVYGKAFIIFIALIVLFKIFQSIILFRLKKLAKLTKSEVDDELIKIVRAIKPPFYSFLAFYLALRSVYLSEFWAHVINVVLIIWFAYQIISAVQIFVNYIFRKRFSEENAQMRTSASVISLLVKGTLWVIALLMVLSNFGVNITSLVAGLGIGGIAIAMALKNILSDLFASFAIYFDKPFLVGDTIVFGDKEGIVEKIGI